MSKPKAGLKILYFIGFFAALSSAFPGYIRSTFLEEFTNVNYVGLFFVGAAFISLIAINFFPLLIKKFTNYRLSLAAIVLNILSIVVLITTSTTWVAFLAFVFTTMSLYLVWINLDVFVERFSSNVSTGRIRTIYFTFINAGWVISPFIVGNLVGDNNYRLAYVFAIFFLLIVLMILIANKKKLADHIKYEHHHLLKTLGFIWRNINFRGIYFIAFLLQLFYTVAVIYIPIYLHETIGFGWSTIGIIFSFMLLPFVLLEIPAGVFADKHSGEKKVLSLGFLILASASALFFFIDSTNPFVWGIILFISRCGAALIEAMRESYFFKIVDVEDIDYINLFRDVSPLALVIGSGLSVLVLQFFPVHYLFIFLSIILLSGLYFTWRIHNVRAKK